MTKPRVATVWLDGCSGCHMSLVDLDEGVRSFERAVDTDPTRAEMTTVLNQRIKKRESFRPFAGLTMERSTLDCRLYFSSLGV